MVTILPKVESGAERFGKSIGGGFEKGVSKGMDFATELAMEKYRRGLMAQQGLASIPEEYRPGEKVAQALKGYKGVQTAIPAEEMIAPEMIEERKTSRSTQVSPEARTRIMTPDEMKNEAGRRVMQYAARNIPTSYPEQLNAVQSENALNLQYQQIQNKASKLATAKLKDMFKDATQEHKDIFSKKAENLLLKGMSQAEINSALTQDIKKFTNQKAAIASLPKYETILRKASRTGLGTIKPEEDMTKTVKAAIKPLLDEGLTDEVRASLADRGYNTEDIESFIFNLSDVARQELANLPKTSTNVAEMKNFQKKISKLNPLDAALAMVTKTSEPTKANMLPKFEESVRSILSKDPNTNLILLRREMMDRGMSWSDYERVVNDMIMSNEYKIPDMQQNAKRILREPPLNFLDKILYTIGMKGR